MRSEMMKIKIVKKNIVAEKMMGRSRRKA